ncbi:MAG: retropepsin-like aspartic protease [Flavobacteriales bacterium]|nr:retroviral-like aspartic protease family protein [Flavobacteriales bacterium]
MRLILSFFLLIPTCSIAQTDRIVNAAGTYLGDRSALLKECMEEMADVEELAVFGLNKVCACYLEMILSIPEVANATDKDALDNLDVDKVLGKDEAALSSFQSCLLSGMAPEFERALIDSCDQRIKGHTNFQGREVGANGICQCIVQRISAGELDVSDLQALTDPNSVQFTELMGPCVDMASALVDPPIVADPNDVSGNEAQGSVPVIKMARLYKVKLRFGQLERYFIIDSGASDPLVTREFAEELIAAGLIKGSDRISDMTYTLADGSTLDCTRYKVHGIGIGTFTVSNVTLAVMPQNKGQFLLGGSFLGKFKKWRIDDGTKQLYLERQ